jgi:beta-glucosidase
VEKSLNAYQNPSIPAQDRAADLLARMSIEEKIAQLGSFMEEQTWSEFARRRTPERIAQIQSLAISSVVGIGIGQISCFIRELPTQAAAEKANEIQQYAKEHTRLSIPPIIHDEGLHGLLGNGTTIFPQAIAMASSWDPNLLLEVAAAIGKETRSRGIRQLLSPTINIARDPRCGRTEETYGEDPYLTSRMALAYVQGIQAEGVIATPKHFAANFVGEGGRDSNAIYISERLLREIYLPAFETCIREGKALSVMAAYNSLDGLPCSCNPWLLTRLLREEWRFTGFVVSDYSSVAQILTKHGVAATRSETAKLALEAGMDVELPNKDCFGQPLLEGIETGLIKEDIVNRSTYRVLETKFRMGLFDDPYVNPDESTSICHNEKHQALALQMEKEAMVLLKNMGGALPISKSIRSLAVVGPLADEPALGGYSWEGDLRGRVITPLQGIRNLVNDTIKVRFTPGCKLIGGDKSGIEAATELARSSDAAVLFVGNTNVTEGEWRDRANLDLPGYQKDLIISVARTGVPTIVVLINGSAITMLDWVDQVGAIVEAWYPGESGGTAIAEVLFGEYNPGGKLPITFPRVIGQLPLYYNHAPSGRTYDYFDVSGKPLFPFGHGLSYTTFTYHDLKISPARIGEKGECEVSLIVENSGNLAGDEVVQLYVHDRLASIVRPVKELKGFRRVHVRLGESVKVTLTLNAQSLGFFDNEMQYVVEPGEFEILVGNSSEDIRLAGKLEVL